MLAVLVASCGGLPEYASPQVRFAEGHVTEGFIRYRPLTRSDFQAKTPPPRMEAHALKVNAHTALVMQLRDGSRIIIEEKAKSGSKRFLVHAEDVSFEALMIPAGSWWNPAVPRDLYTYILQHEQVHFALMEIKVRELNRIIKEQRGQFVVYTGDPDGAKQRMFKIIDEMLNRANEEMLREHTAFDEETSGRVDPSRQDRWFADVTTRLAGLR